MNNMIKFLEKSPIISILTLNNAEESMHIADALINEGLSNLEVTLRTPNALNCIEAIAKKFPNVKIGAGTITSKEQLQQVKDVGAIFALSPGWTANLVNEAKKINLEYLPGVSTPSEIMALSEMGVNFQKFFHANHLGGYKMIKSYANIFPQVKFCPTGGISEKDFKDYLALDNVTCVGGSWMVQESDIKEKNYGNIRNMAKFIKENI